MKLSLPGMDHPRELDHPAKTLKAYARPLLKRYKMPSSRIETYQAASGTKSSINCSSGRCTGGKGAAAPLDVPPWLLP